MNKIPVDDLMKDMEAYSQGLQSGREMAIKKYDRMFVELYDKMQSIEDKFEKLLYALGYAKDKLNGTEVTK